MQIRWILFFRLAGKLFAKAIARTWSRYYLAGDLINASITSTQPTMKNKPPNGVIGPRIETRVGERKDLIDNKYKEPEKQIIPAVKK